MVNGGSNMTEDFAAYGKKSPVQKNNNTRNRMAGIIVLIIICIIGGTAAYFYWKYLSSNIITDNAYVKGHMHMVSSRIDGTVKEVYIKENMKVKIGDLLVKIDPSDFEAAVEKAKASLELAKQEVKRRYAAVEAAKANVELSRANLELSKITLERAKLLFEKGVAPKEKYDEALTNYRVASAKLKADEEDLKEKQAVVSPENDEALIREKAAQLSQEELNLEYTSIYSPADGFITKKNVEVGNRVSEGQPLFAIVPLDDIWIEANFKETQIQKIKPGMKAKIEVDTFSGKKFSGYVESIMAGTGGAFLIFPPENATGNWVKVVQRIPVKIVFDKGQHPNNIFRVGMSCVVSIPLE